MKYQFLSRDVLKLIAILSMLIDHVGKLFFPNILFLQIVGRLAFPIFAFFIAEGFYYTRNKVKYFFTILVFAVIAQIPYNFLWHGLNVLFTFSCALFLLALWDGAKKLALTEKIILRIISLFVLVVLICLSLLTNMDYGWYGLLLPVFFFIFRNHVITKFAIFVGVTVLYIMQNLWGVVNLCFDNFLQLFALLSIMLLAFYNDSYKGYKQLKYVFYVFYPLHLVILLLLTLI